MKKTISKKEAGKIIEDFFKNLAPKGVARETSGKISTKGNKSPNEVKKIKRLAMQFNIPLKEKRKLFCRKCFVAYGNSKVRIKNGRKIVVCRGCGKRSGWKL